MEKRMDFVFKQMASRELYPVTAEGDARMAKQHSQVFF
jgi:hypothetical protein